MSDSDIGLLESELGRYERVLEVGIGARDDLAMRLSRAGVAVLAVDIEALDLPTPIAFIQADIRHLDPASVTPIDAVYARRLPPELHRPVARFAQEVNASLYFTTLGGEFPDISVDMITGPTETVYVRQPESGRIL